MEDVSGDSGDRRIRRLLQSCLLRQGAVQPSWPAMECKTPQQCSRRAACMVVFACAHTGVVQSGDAVTGRSWHMQIFSARHQLNHLLPQCRGSWLPDADRSVCSRAAPAGNPCACMDISMQSTHQRCCRQCWCTVTCSTAIPGHSIAREQVPEAGVVVTLLQGSMMMSNMQIPCSCHQSGAL